MGCRVLCITTLLSLSCEGTASHDEREGRGSNQNALGERAHVVSQHSGLCLAAGAFDGAPVTQERCSTTVEIEERIVGTGLVELRPSGADRCIEMPGSSRSDLTQAVLWPCWGGANQRFQVTDLGNGLRTYRNQHSGKCLDILSWSTSGGAAVVQYTCHGGANQQFKPRVTAPPSPPPAPTTTGLVAMHSGLCVRAASVADGEPLIQGACTPAFALEARPVSGGVELRPAGSALCIEMPGSSTQNLTQAVLWPCWGGANQLWVATAQGDGSSSYRNVNSGKCLDILSWSTSAGAQVVQYDCTGGANQRFALNGSSSSGGGSAGGGSAGGGSAGGGSAGGGSAGGGSAGGGSAGGTDDPPSTMSAARVTELMSMGPNGDNWLAWNYRANWNGAVNSVGARLKHNANLYNSCNVEPYQSMLPTILIQWMTIGFKNQGVPGSHNIAVEMVPMPVQGRVKPALGGPYWVTLTAPTGAVASSLIAPSGSTIGMSNETRRAGRITRLSATNILHPWAVVDASGSVDAHVTHLVSSNPLDAFAESRVDDIVSTWWVRLVPYDPSRPIGDVTSNPILAVASADPYVNRPRTGLSNDGQCNAGIAANSPVRLTTSWQQISWHTSTEAPDRHTNQPGSGVSNAEFLRTPPPGYQ